MRRILALLVLLATAALWAGCGSDNTTAPNANSTGTTTYNTSAPTTAAPSGGGANTTGAAPKATPTAPGIKPPTEK